MACQDCLEYEDYQELCDNFGLSMLGNPRLDDDQAEIETTDEDASDRLAAWAKHHHRSADLLAAQIAGDPQIEITSEDNTSVMEYHGNDYY